MYFTNIVPDICMCVVENKAESKNRENGEHNYK